MSIGSSIIYRNKNKQPIATSYLSHYRYRGEKLEFLCFYEYISQIEVVSKPNMKGKDKDDTYNEEEDDDGDVQQRRPKTSEYQFDIRHPLYESHIQKGRSKQLTPIILGYFFPSLSKKTIKNKQSVANFTTLFFLEWDIITALPTKLSWLNFTKLMQVYEYGSVEDNKSPKYILYNRYCILRNMFTILKISSSTKKTLAKYDVQNATIWNKTNKKHIANDEYETEIMEDCLQFENGEKIREELQQRANDTKPTRKITNRDYTKQ
jgi:hypothetical protein